ncbi:hypothetical protein Q3G72_013262 [Acer saccharum]|nr:hypothetical protein Q3G72_013262 [Acer saccharum]
MKTRNAKHREVEQRSIELVLGSVEAEVANTLAVGAAIGIDFSEVEEEVMAEITRREYEDLARCAANSGCVSGCLLGGCWGRACFGLLAPLSVFSLLFSFAPVGVAVCALNPEFLVKLPPSTIRYSTTSYIFYSTANSLVNQNPTDCREIANTIVNDTDPADDFQFLLAEQHAKLTAAQSLESDLDFAFRLQFEEAISASIANLPSSSKPSLSLYSSQRRQQQPTQNDIVVTTFVALQFEELMKTELELADSDQAKLEMRKTREELNPLIHDQMFAKELSSIPDNEWSEWGGKFTKPYGRALRRASLTTAIASLGSISRDW